MTLFRRIIYWAPRLMSIGFVLFLSLFSLDVFSEYSGLEAIVPFLIHSIPAITLLVFSIFAWKHEWVGIIMYLGFAVLYVLDVGFTRPVSWYLAIVLPSFIVSLLYFVSWVQKRKH